MEQKMFANKKFENRNKKCSQWNKKKLLNECKTFMELYKLE